MKPGLYQHYRGNYYQVLGMGRHSESLEEMVVYRALYADYGLWVRPVDIFKSKVIENGKEVDRFTFIRELDLEAPGLR
jgi:hypothetical protein